MPYLSLKLHFIMKCCREFSDHVILTSEEFSEAPMWAKLKKTFGTP